MDGGAELAANKKTISASLDAAGATSAEKSVILAMGLQETQTLNSGSRDTSKDGTASENVSAFNLSPGEVKSFGFQGDPRSLNDPSKLGQTADLILSGIRSKGTNDVLNLTRGGSTAEQDGVSYGAADYRAGIIKTANIIQQDPSLFTDSTRVAPDTVHV